MPKPHMCLAQEIDVQVREINSETPSCKFSDWSSRELAKTDRPPIPFSTRLLPSRVVCELLWTLPRVFLSLPGPHILVDNIPVDGDDALVDDELGSFVSLHSTFASCAPCLPRLPYGSSHALVHNIRHLFIITASSPCSSVHLFVRTTSSPCSSISHGGAFPSNLNTSNSLLLAR